jgi:hypothetical protein
MQGTASGSTPLDVEGGTKLQSELTIGVGPGPEKEDEQGLETSSPVPSKYCPWQFCSSSATSIPFRSSSAIPIPFRSKFCNTYSVPFKVLQYLFRSVQVLQYPFRSVQVLQYPFRSVQVLCKSSVYAFRRLLSRSSVHAVQHQAVDINIPPWTKSHPRRLPEPDAQVTDDRHIKEIS